MPEPNLPQSSPAGSPLAPASHPESHSAPAASIAPAIEPGTANLVRIAASFVIAACVVTTLYLARPVLLPFALATLLAFALAPMVSLLGHWGFNRAVAVICAVVFAVTIFAGLAMFIGTQLSHLVPDVPRYQATLLGKIQSIRSSATRSNLFANATKAFDNFDNAISPDGAFAQHPATGFSAAARRDRPVPVEIHSPDPGPFQILENIVDPLLMPIALGGLVVIFVIFILLQKEDLRDRFISLAGARDLQRTTQAIDEGAQKLSRYLLLQSAVNASFGLWIAAGLWLIGIPSPALWGLIAAIARFVPYVGVPVAAALPLLLALAVDPHWTMVAFTAALFFGTEAVTGQAIEPWLYGRHLGLSAIAVVSCAVFWTWIWGPVGLLLSTPLTMCMAIIGRNVEHLKFLDILLGDHAPLSPDEAFYLSMLAGRTDEEAARAELLLKDGSPDDYLDRVAIKGLVLAHLDESRGALDAAGAEKIHGSLRQLLEDLSDPANASTGNSGSASSQAQPAPVLCVAGRGELDSAAGTLLAAMLQRDGIASRVISPEMTSSSRMTALDHAGVRVVCLSYLAPCTRKNARYLVRRLRRHLPQVPIIAGFWNDDRSDTTFLDALEATACDGIATTLADAVAQIAVALKTQAASVPAPAVGDTEPETDDAPGLEPQAATA